MTVILWFFRLIVDDMATQITTAVTQVFPATISDANMTLSSTPNATGLSINVHGLFQRLSAIGILSGTENEVTNDNSNETWKAKSIYCINTEALKQRLQSHIDVLYGGMPCSNCNLRFDPKDTLKYTQHLDWHFWQNHLLSTGTPAQTRRWYCRVTDWKQYEEIENVDKSKSNFFATQQLQIKSALPNESPLPRCVTGLNDVDKKCEMCHDKFEAFYNDENEEWHLRNAIRVEGKTFHPICFEDYKPSNVTYASIDDGYADEDSFEEATIMEAVNGECNQYF